MNFIFISPDFPKTYYRFCQELKRLGVNVLGIASDNYFNLEEELRSSLTEYYRVSSLENYDEVYRAVAYFAFKYGKIDYIESNNEYWLEQDARLRTDFNVNTGRKNEDIIYFKSKEAMKTCYKKAGVKVARYHIPTTLDAGLKFIEEVGYPVILKPDNGVGANDTYKINNQKELEDFYNHLPKVKYIMEEFIDGYLLSFDGVVDKESNPTFFSQEVYSSERYPFGFNELVGKDSDVFFYCDKTCPKDLEEAGRNVLKAFGAKSRYFHLEFFRLKSDKKGLGKKGDIIGLETNMRCPGGYIPDMINFANSVNTYKIWADTIVNDKTNEDMSLPHFYCGHYGRRKEHHYEHTTYEIFDRYKEKIVMYERMPDVLADGMGNEVFIIKCNTLEELDDFQEYCSK